MTFLPRTKALHRAFRFEGQEADPTQGYGPYITKAIDQSNLPKSSLSKYVSGIAEGYAPGVFAGLNNAQSMGNSFYGLPAQAPYQAPTPQRPQQPGGAGGFGGTSGPSYNARPAAPSVTRAFNPLAAPDSNYNPGSIDPYDPKWNTSSDPLSLGGISHQAINTLGDAGRQGLYDQILGAARNRVSIDPNTPLYDAQGNRPIGSQINSYHSGVDASYLGPEAQDIWSYLLSGGDASAGASAGGGQTGRFPGGFGDASANFISSGGAGDQNFRLTPGDQASDVGGFIPDYPGQQGNVPQYGTNPPYPSQPGPGGQGGGQGSYGDQYAFPQFNSANPQLAGLLSQPGSQQSLQTLLQQLQGPQVGNYNPSGDVLGGLGGGLGNLIGNLNQGGQANIQQGIQDSDYIKNLTQSLQNQFTQGRADLRARFGAGGGGSRGTGASFAESQYNSQNLPILASALGQARQQEVGNILQNQSLGNQFNLGAGNLIGGLAGQAGQQNLGLQGLGSQNFLGAQGLNSQNAGTALQALLGGQGQQNNLLSQLAQFNAGQGNAFGLGLQSQRQSALESQLARGFTGQQNLASIIAALAGAGIPGGSANVNLSPVPPSPNPLNQIIGSALGGII